MTSFNQAALFSFCPSSPNTDDCDLPSDVPHPEIGYMPEIGYIRLFAMRDQYVRNTYNRIVRGIVSVRDRSISIDTSSREIDTVDARQLERFGLDERGID